MDLQKLAEVVYNNAFRDELQKMAQQSDPMQTIKDYAPAALALGLSIPAMNAGSRIGRSLTTEAVPLLDWFMAKAKPQQGVGQYIGNMVGNRYGAAHAGTFGGAALGALGVLALYNQLKNQGNPLS